MQAFSILSNEKHQCVVWSRHANVFESVAMYSSVILLGHIESLNKNKFEYQRLWLKNNIYPEGKIVQLPTMCQTACQ